MKKKILCLAMSVLMLIGTPLTVNAEQFKNSNDWNVVFDGKQMNDNFTNSEFTETILNIQPGDSITVKVHVKNNDSVKTDWYLNNEVLKTLENSDAGKKAEAEGGAYTYLLEYYGQDGQKVTLYDSKILGGEGDDIEKEGEGLEQATFGYEEEFVYLDRLKTGESGYVQLYIELDGETQGNDYQNTLGQLRMSFAVEKVKDKTITKEIEVEKEDKDIVVVRKLVPGMVKTGDNSKVILFSVLTLISGVALLGYVFVFMKKNSKGEK